MVGGVLRGRALLGGLAALTALAPGCARQPDVIFLTVDTLRVDHVGAFAADSPARTPAIDALAADGIVYTQAWSPISVTGPAFCTLHTGQLPGSHGVVMNLFRGGPSLPLETETLAERLRDAGYANGAFVSGFTLRKDLALWQGFPVYQFPPPGERRRMGNKTARRLLHWFDGLYPWDDAFIWYHSYDPHGPLGVWSDPPRPGEHRLDSEELRHYPEYQRVPHVSDPAWYAGEYAKAVHFADSQVGRIVERLKQTGRYERALIVFTADHGESFDERPQWFSHGNYASAEQLHVPLVVKLPDNARAGERVDVLVGLQDVAPTVLDVLDLPPLPAADGRSLLDHPGYDVVVGESSHCKEEPLLRCTPRGVKGKEVAARSVTGALVQTPTAEGREVAVYDRVADPGERTPLPAAAPPADLAAAVAPVRAARDALDLVVPESDDEGVDPEEQEALKALGYVE